MECRVCLNVEGNRTFVAREMMFGLREEFRYFECASCGCLQIVKPPADLSAYYPAGYYAHEAPQLRTQGALKRALKKRWAQHELGKANPLGFLISQVFPKPAFFRWFRVASIQLDDSILDVGCGNGQDLLAIRGFGFSDLLGIDPYVSASLEYPNGVSVIKCELDSMQGDYRFVMLNHSFEHMAEPLKSMREIARILDPDGTAMIRIPVADSHAWRHYGADWFQLDAPRHLFIHTRRSMQMLADASGLIITRVEQDSTAAQFWASEQYRMNVPLCDMERSYLVNPNRSHFSRRDIQRFEREAERLNDIGEGDQACFFLSKRPAEGTFSGEPADGPGSEQIRTLKSIPGPI